MRIAFTTLGCRLNQFETEAMRRRVSTQAHAVAWGDVADVYVINSCTVTARAEQKCRQLARGAKRRHPHAKVMVVGCYSQLAGKSLVAIEEIDAALGNEEKKRIENYLERVVAGGPLVAAAPFQKGMTLDADEWIEDFGGHARATIKVQEGCNMRCTFCAIWSARGPSRSRAPRAVVEQAQRLAEVGFEEIVLGGVHLGHYGRDLQPRTNLISLLEMLLEVVDERVRFRLSSIDPSEVDARLANALASTPRLCRYLHLPLQAGSNRVLRAMRRPYSVEYYARLVEEIAEIDPDFGLGIDLIAGFPEETSEDFEATLSLLEGLPISFYHVFPYSDRPGTPASIASGKVSRAVIQDRARQLRELGARKREAFLRRHVGRVYEGVVEGPRADGKREVMLDTYATLWADVPAEFERQRVAVAVEELDEEGHLLGHGLHLARHGSPVRERVTA